MCRNLQSFCDAAGALSLLSALAYRMSCKDIAELECMSCASVLLLINLLAVALPFKFFGNLVVFILCVARGFIIKRRFCLDC